MRTAGRVIGAFIIAIVFTFIGYSIGIQSNNNLKVDSEKDTSIIGIYHSPSWNGREATLALNEDGTCKYPGYGTTEASWNQTDDGKIFIELEGNKYEVTIVDNGVILHEKLFVKIKS